MIDLPWIKTRPARPGWYRFRKPTFSADVYSVDVRYRGILIMGQATDRWFQEGEWSGPFSAPLPESDRRAGRDRRMGERRKNHRRISPRRTQATTGNLQQNTVTRY